MWTEIEIENLKIMYSDNDNKYLSDYFNKSTSLIVSKANGIGLRKSKDYITLQKKSLNPKTFWSDDELNFIVNNYRNMSNNDISIKLNKNKRLVIRKLKELNLTRTKTEKDLITSISCKRIGRDLNFNNIKEIALKFNTKHEFYLYDYSAYNCAIKNGWLDELCSHMDSKRESIPQLLLKDCLEFMLKCGCSFNDRKVIYPKEIDCYFDKYKIGWEYDGKYFHESVDRNKIDICKSKNITLFIIDENNPNYRDYENNILNQLIEQLPMINELTGLDIKEDIIRYYKPKLKYESVFTKSEIDLVYDKNLSYIKNEYPNLYKRIIRYKIKMDVINIIDDRKKYNRFVNYTEYLQYLRSNYTSLKECLKKEHPYRVFKRFGIDKSEIYSIWG